MIYEQSIYWTKINYINKNFWHETNCMSGIRKENKKAVKLDVGRSLFDEIELSIDSNRILNLKKYFIQIKNDLKNTNIDFDAIIYLHNEIVLIDKIKRDNRSFGFMRLLIKMNGTNIYNEDIPLYTSSLYAIEEIVSCRVNDHYIRYSHIGSRKEKKFFKNIPHVFSPKAAGYFMHEIMGHLLESDYYNYCKDMYSNIDIVPQLTVTDSVQGFQDIVGLNEYDDTGNKMRNLILIKDGKINNIMAVDKKDSFDTKLYGFARRATYKDNIMARMRNTYIEPHENMNTKDILRQYEKAIFVQEINLGLVNPDTGEFKLYGNGYVVKNGNTKNFIGDLCIFGNIVKNISMIDYIGNDFKVYGSYCGKLGQSVRVGCGGPSISLTALSSEGVMYGRG